MNIGDELTLNDTNGVLHNFEVSKENKINASIDGNTLKITANEVGDGSLTITKKDKNYSHPAIVYFHPSGQDLMMRGSYDPVDVDIKVKIVGGKVSVKKIDMDTQLGIAQGDATLDGAVYGIYDMEGKELVRLLQRWRICNE